MTPFSFTGVGELRKVVHGWEVISQQHFYSREGAQKWFGVTVAISILHQTPEMGSEYLKLIGKICIIDHGGFKDGQVI